MSRSVKDRIFDWLYRREFSSGIISFDELLGRAYSAVAGGDGIAAEGFAAAYSRQYFNWLLQDLDESRSCGRVPEFGIVDAIGRRLVWSAHDLHSLASAADKHRRLLLASRPSILSAIDDLSDREYEAAGCLVCRMLRAHQVHLTPRGNEGGVDFYAMVNLPSRSHVLLGAAGPLRIVGQCKKYSSRVQIDKIEGFITTLNNVRHQTPKVEEHVPAWFRSCRGPVIGWMIAHSGFQSGAISAANNHGILISDSRDLAEIAALSRRVAGHGLATERALAFKAQVGAELSAFYPGE